VLRIALAVLHLLALGIGLSAVLARASFLKERPTPLTVRRVLRADLEWGLAAALWIGSGLWRWLAGTEKDPSYYVANHLFLTKMGVLLLIFGLELWPMVTFMKWRTAIAKGAAPEAVADPGTASRIARISNVQALLVVVMIVLAVAMARGFGAT
jgi:putative membrane protein